MTTTNPKLVANLRTARKLLPDAKCTCEGKHVWAKCPRMLAECAVDDALAMMGVYR
jgi:hypothetical protein